MNRSGLVVRGCSSGSEDVGCDDGQIRSGLVGYKESLRVDQSKWRGEGVGEMVLIRTSGISSDDGCGAKRVSMEAGRVGQRFEESVYGSPSRLY